MKNKRYISFVALWLCMIMLLSACGGEAGKIAEDKTIRYYYDVQQKPDEEVEYDEEVEGAPKRVSYKVPSDEQGLHVDQIVYSPDVSNELASAIKDFKNALKKNRRYDISAVFDKIGPLDEYEILIGQTNRKESKDAYNTVKNARNDNYDDFLIKVVNKKIVINGVSERGVQSGMKFVLDTFCKSEEYWPCLTDGYVYHYAPDYGLAKITVAGTDISKYSIIYPRYMETVYGKEICNLSDYFIDTYHFSLNLDDERFLTGKKEIYIGDINTEASNSVSVGSNEYVIACVGDKIVIKGSNSPCLSYGVAAFAQMILNAQKSKKALNITDGFIVRKTLDFSDETLYRLTFSDEFEGSALNTSLWSTYEAENSTNSSLGGWVERKGIERAYVKDGSLHLPAKRVDEKNFEKTAISLKKNLWAKYGCLEVKAKLADSPAYSTIWYNADYYGVGAEIDMLENFGNDLSFASNIHKWFVQPTWDGTNNYAHTSLDGGKYSLAKRFTYNTSKYKDKLSDDYHVYSLEWTDEYYAFYVDGIRFFKYVFKDNSEEVDAFRQKLYLILSCGVGESGYGARYNVETSAADFDYAIDYVRFYQQPSVGELDYNFYR
ncbi:MAG: glycoside hydrolase family 16 protein [Clostridia bacterium]|nr:glycoside hydrolase family 16 protein [Clostridia bacterium]